MSTEYQDYCNANYGPDDEPTREEQEGDAWEYWHQRAVKLEADLHATLKSVLYHFGPEGAQKVTTSALASLSASERGKP